jgi:hypothetical protein
MLKDKYLHRKYGKSGQVRYESEKHKKEKNLDLFSDLPFHKSIGKKYRIGYDITPLREFIKSKVGYDWDDVYSEILTKIDNKFRYDIDYSISRILKAPIYDENFIPRDDCGSIYNNRLFIDMDNIIRKYSKYENISISIKFMRREKLRKMLENRDETEEDDNENGLFEG